MKFEFVALNKPTMQIFTSCSYMEVCIIDAMFNKNSGSLICLVVTGRYL